MLDQHLWSERGDPRLVEHFTGWPAYSMVYRLSQEEGVLVGQSSGAAMFAAIKVARKLRSGTIVTIFPDFGDKYLTTNLWVGWRDRMAVGNLKFSI